LKTPFFRSKILRLGLFHFSLAVLEGEFKRRGAEIYDSEETRDKLTLKENE